jgi:hypothetical protein
LLALRRTKNEPGQSPLVWKPILRLHRRLSTQIIKNSNSFLPTSIGPLASAKVHPNRPLPPSLFWIEPARWRIVNRHVKRPRWPNLRGNSNPLLAHSLPPIFRQLEFNPQARPESHEPAESKKFACLPYHGSTGDL